MTVEETSFRDRFHGTIRIRKSTGEGAILAGLGVLGLFAVIYSQMQLPLQNPFGAGVGPRLFPQLAGAIMLLMSVYLLGRRFYRRRKGTLDEEVVTIDVQDGLRVLVFIALSLGYMALFEELGLLVSTSTLLFLLFVTNGFDRYVLAAALAGAFTIAIYLLFNVALSLPLPAPVLNDLLGGVI